MARVTEHEIDLVKLEDYIRHGGPKMFYTKTEEEGQEPVFHVLRKTQVLDKYDEFSVEDFIGTLREAAKGLEDATVEYAEEWEQYDSEPRSFVRVVGRVAPTERDQELIDAKERR